MDIYKVNRNFVLWERIGFCASKIEECVKTITDLPTSPISATVGFVGIPAAIACMEDKAVANIYEELTYVSIDGMPIINKCRNMGIECERCSGPDVMEMIIEKGIKSGKTHYFYGGKDDTVLDNIKFNLKKRYPQIKIVGMYSPPFRELTLEEDDDICKQINRLHPDYVWVGIGQPKQDYWLKMHREKLNDTTILGVGAAFDFIAGTLNRAPDTVRRMGVEWLYRLVKEPRRLWNRYVIGGVKYVFFNLRYRNIRL